MTRFRNENISVISLTSDTDDHNHIMNDDIIDDDNEKMIGTRRTTSMTIANNKRKYHLVTINNAFTGI